MMSFLLQEGVITIGTVSGIFTALLLNSIKNNMIDPLVEKIAPINNLLSRPSGEIVDDIKDDGKLNNSNNKNKQNSPQSNQKMFPVGALNTHNYGNQFGGPGKNEIKWKIFMRDFITWLIIMLLLYLAWKHVIQPIKNKNGVVSPTHNTQFIPMNAGMGKKIK
jgi:large-conductance mechanosensitive channel